MGVEAPIYIMKLHILFLFCVISIALATSGAKVLEEPMELAFRTLKPELSIANVTRKGEESGATLVAKIRATTLVKLWDTEMECVILTTTVNVEVETVVGVTSSKMYEIDFKINTKLVSF